MRLKLHDAERVLPSLVRTYVFSMLASIGLAMIDLVPMKISLCIGFLVFPAAVALWTIAVGVSVGAAAGFVLATLPWSLRAILGVFSHTKKTPSISATKEFRCPLPLPDKIDAIISWVNVTDTAWQGRAKEHGCPVDSYISGAGDADPFETMRYGIRSIRKHMKFIDKIFITTEDQQVSWLNEAPSLGDGDGSVSLAPHAWFMDSEILPVFNSQPTEYSIYKIFEKNFTKYPCFLYLNDDFLIMKDLQISDFIDPQTGRVVFYGYQHVDIPVGPGFVDLPYGFLGFPDKIGESVLETLMDPHVPYLVNYWGMADYMKSCGNSCDEIFTNKCNRKGRLWPEAYFGHMLKHNSMTFVSPIDGFTRRFGLGLTFMEVQKNIDMIELVDPMFVYIESHNSLEHRPGAIEIVKAFLERHFPDKGRWEL